MTVAEFCVLCGTPSSKHCSWLSCFHHRLSNPIQHHTSLLVIHEFKSTSQATLRVPVNSCLWARLYIRNICYVCINFACMELNTHHMTMVQYYLTEVVQCDGFTYVGLGYSKPWLAGRQVADGAPPRCLTAAHMRNKVKPHYNQFIGCRTHLASLPILRPVSKGLLWLLAPCHLM